MKNKQRQRSDTYLPCRATNASNAAAGRASQHPRGDGPGGLLPAAVNEQRVRDKLSKFGGCGATAWYRETGSAGLDGERRE